MKKYWHRVSVMKNEKHCYRLKKAYWLSISENILLTLWCPATFGDLKKKHRNACGFARELLHFCQKTRQAFCSALEKNILVGGHRFFVSDVISGGLLSHLGPHYLTLGANH